MLLALIGSREVDGAHLLDTSDECVSPGTTREVLHLENDIPWRSGGATTLNRLGALNLQHCWSLRTSL
jgi:hypothetical protein